MEKRLGDLKKLVKDTAGNLFWIKVSDVGNDAVGKTCLIKYFCEKKFTKTYYSTVGVDYGFKICKVNGIDYRIHLWDFGGHEDYDEIRRELYHQTQACILVYDVTNRHSFESLDSWLQEFMSSEGAQKTVFAVVANKIDLNSKRTVSTKDGERWAKAHNLRYYETSASTGKGVEEMFNSLLNEVIDNNLIKAKPVISVDSKSK